MNPKRDQEVSGSGSLSWKEFSAQLKHLWEREGSIQKSLDLVTAHPEHRKNPGRTGRRQILRALGEDRLISGRVVIPERVSSPVYSPLPGRIMYCVYSTPVFNSNGYSTRSRGVAAGLKSAGADVVVASRAGYPWDWKIDSIMPAQARTVSELDGINYVHLPYGAMDALSPSAHIEQAADAFAQEALIQRPSFIQAASNYRVALPALIAARRLGIPFIYEVRGLWEITGVSNNPGFEKTDRYSSMRDYESRVARAADHVFAITPQVKAELISRGVEETRISLAPNAVDPEKFRPVPPDADMAVSMGLEPGIPVIGFAGSIVKYEGLQTLLEASRILNDKGVKHQVALAGSGNTVLPLQNYAAKHHMEWVHFLGRIPQEQVPVLLSVSDIIVTPRDSTVITELVSALKPLEAFSAGRAVVLSDVAPNKDLAGSDESRAKLFTAGDSSSFADAIEGLLLNPSERVKLAKSARKWIETERNWHSIGSNMFEQIQKLGQQPEYAETPSINLKDLRVGLISDTKLRNLFESFVSVDPITGSDYRLDELRNLDFVVIDISKAGVESSASGNEKYSMADPAIQNLLEECGHSGIPRVGLLAEGVRGSNFEPKYAPFLDVCLSGKFEGVVEFLEDPLTADLRVGSFPPLLGSSRLNSEAQDIGHDSVCLSDNSGLRSSSFGGLLELFDTSPSVDEEAIEEFPSTSIDDGQDLPSAIYVRLNTPDLLKRDLISKYGLEVPIIWEGQNETSIWYGDTFAEEISLIEFLAAYHHWQKNPELRSALTNYQRNRLEGAHSLKARLILLSRSLGIPVTNNNVTETPVGQGDEIAWESSFRTETLAALLQDKSDELAPLILDALKD